jgi:dipeptidyl aminopeptidase/acylaminoacyl peptidase
MKKILFFLLISTTLIGCVEQNIKQPPRQRTIYFTIESTPPGADIYWGDSKNTLTNSGFKTPFTEDITNIEPSFRSLYFQVKKKNYFDSKVIFKRKTSGNRNIKYTLAEKNDGSVSVTGAAGTLNRVTIGGAHEFNPAISSDNKYLIFQASGTGSEYTKSGVLKKYDIKNASVSVLTPLSSDSIEPAWLSDNKSFVFSSNRLNKYTIVQSLGVSGGSGVKFISPISLANARMPQVSPNGKTVAFSIYDSQNDNQISTITLKGFNLKILGSGYKPKWSPDGKTLLFIRKVGKNTNIYTMNAKNGSQLIEMTSSDSNESDIFWSPNGKSIAFISDRVRGRRHLFTMNKYGHNIKQLTDGKYDVQSVTWSKNNIIYFSANAGDNYDIWSLKPNIK